MASRQNREARPEYPTGHNKGNDSPDRDVPPGRTFGAPTTIPPVSDDTSFRDELLATEVTPEERASKIEDQLSGGAAETRARAEEEARNRATAAPEEENPTADLTIGTAIDRLKKHQDESEGTDRD